MLILSGQVIIRPTGYPAMWRRSFSKTSGQIPLTFPSVKRDAFPGPPGRLRQVKYDKGKRNAGQRQPSFVKVGTT
jgi:hypothetical protein